MDEKLTRQMIKAYCEPNPWHFGNKVLYDLCADFPEHGDLSQVIAKVWLIGRSYAAAIERGRKRGDQNDDFYVETVGPLIVNSGLDKWLKEVRKISLCTENQLEFVQCHENTMELFRDISGLKKRSLASKYLHFHQPEVFFIYDSRAARGLSKFSKTVGRASRSNSGDDDYRKFFEKCLRLRDAIKSKYSVHLTPRDIDNILLGAEQNQAKSFIL